MKTMHNRLCALFYVIILIMASLCLHAGVISISASGGLKSGMKDGKAYAIAGVDEEVTFTASASAVNGTIGDFKWDVGDGTVVDGDPDKDASITVTWGNASVGEKDTVSVGLDHSGTRGEDCEDSDDELISADVYIPQFDVQVNDTEDTSDDYVRYNDTLPGGTVQRYPINCQARIAAPSNLPDDVSVNLTNADGDDHLGFDSEGCDTLVLTLSKDNALQAFVITGEDASEDDDLDAADIIIHDGDSGVDQLYDQPVTVFGFENGEMTLDVEQAYSVMLIGTAYSYAPFDGSGTDKAHSIGFNGTVYLYPADSDRTVPQIANLTLAFSQNVYAGTITSGHYNDPTGPSGATAYSHVMKEEIFSSNYADSDSDGNIPNFGSTTTPNNPDSPDPDLQDGDWPGCSYPANMTYACIGTPAGTATYTLNYMNLNFSFDTFCVIWDSTTTTNVVPYAQASWQVQITQYVAVGPGDSNQNAEILDNNDTPSSMPITVTPVANDKRNIYTTGSDGTSTVTLP
jgi:hypothetical protein